MLQVQVCSNNYYHVYLDPTPIQVYISKECWKLNPDYTACKVYETHPSLSTCFKISEVQPTSYYVDAHSLGGRFVYSFYDVPHKKLKPGNWYVSMDQHTTTKVVKQSNNIYLEIETFVDPYEEQINLLFHK